jgi:SAM-dependent methyltransferase
MKNEDIKQPKSEHLKDLGSFDVEPEYAYLWDRCVYELLYDPEKYVKELSDLLNQHGVDKVSNILDTSAGSGFPALDMCESGYKNMVCVDGSDDQISLFNEKAETKGLDIRSQKCSWEDLPQHFDAEQFKALICKGSIWYAGGGWNKEAVPDRESSLKALRETLSIFYSLLSHGGVLYLDKFKDDEIDHKDAVGTFEVQGKKKELIFYTHREKDLNIRRAKMLIKDLETGVEEGLPNVTYDLKAEELEDALVEVGFTVIRPELSEEKFFSTWLAVKG